VRLISQENHRLYAEIHGYDLHMFTSPDAILYNERSRMNVTVRGVVLIGAESYIMITNI
jgi:hypothetical protein